MFVGRREEEFERDICEPCRQGYHVECKVATGEWDGTRACKCDCVSHYYSPTMKQQRHSQVVGCPDCDIEWDGAPDACHRAHILFCPLHENARHLYSDVRAEAVIQAKLARQYGADARQCSRTMSLRNVYRRTLGRLLQILRAARPKVAKVQL